MNLRKIIFGEKAAKSSQALSRDGQFFDSPAYPFVDTSFQRIGLAQPTSPLKYDFNSEQRAYSTHELIYACINKLADVMSDAELIVEVQTRDGWAKQEGHPLPALFKRPNMLESGRDYRRLLIQSEQMMGISYSEISRSAAGLPVELHPLNPIRLQPWPNYSNGSIAFYRYTRPDGAYYDILPENLLIRRRADICNRFWGLSPLSVALKSINSDLGLTDYIDAFFESDGTPTGILKVLNTTLTDTKKQALASGWKRIFGRRGTNAKGVAVLDQNADYQSVGSKLNELDSDKVSDRFESRICSVFGVPPILVGAGVGIRHTKARATAREALRDFWDNKVNGEMSTMREWLTWFILPEYEGLDAIKADKVRVAWDISHVAFLQEDADGIHARARENFKAGGWTLNEFREATGMPPDEVKGSDYYIQPVNVVAVTPQIRAQEADKEPQAAPAQPADPNADPNNPDTQPEPPKATEPDHQKKTIEWDGLTLGREPRGVELVIDLKSLVSDQDAGKAKATQILTRFRDKLINQAATALDKLDPADAHTLSLTPDADTVKAIRKCLQSAYRRGRAEITAELAAQRAAKNIAPLLELKDDVEDDDSFLDELTDLAISKIISEIKNRSINAYTALKLLLNYSVEKLKQVLGDESTKFVEQVAGNVINASIRTGRDAEIENNLDEIDHCEYSAVLDANTCGPCEDADGEVGATPADLPDAPNPDCEGGANCRCFIVGIIV